MQSRRHANFDKSLIQSNMAVASKLTFSKIFQAFCVGLTLGMVCTYVIFSYYDNLLASNGITSLNKAKVKHKSSKYGGDSDVSEVHGHDRLSKPKRPTNLRINSNVDFNKDMDDDHHKQSKNITFKIKVLCWVMTSPKSIEKKGKAVKETWGKRCDKLLFMSSKEDKRFPAVGLDVPEGHENLWYKTRAAWQYVYDHHLNDADWFIKADDDTYVIVENLKYLCSKYKSEEPHFFGRRFKTFGGYNSGGAGYVFSKETLKRFVKVMKDPNLCKEQSFAEDVEVGKCLANVGVHPGDARDSRKREMFHPFPPEHHLIPGYVPKDNWLYQYNHYPVKDGPDCCADHSVAFHYIDPSMMYQLEYFVYHLRPYGVEHHD